MIINKKLDWRWLLAFVFFGSSEVLAASITHIGLPQGYKPAVFQSGNVDPGYTTWPLRISADGSTVVGAVNSVLLPGFAETLAWSYRYGVSSVIQTAEVGSNGLGVRSVATSVSSDGSAIGIADIDPTSELLASKHYIYQNNQLKLVYQRDYDFLTENLKPNQPPLSYSIIGDTRVSGDGSTVVVNSHGIDPVQEDPFSLIAKDGELVGDPIPENLESPNPQTIFPSQTGNILFSSQPIDPAFLEQYGYENRSAPAGYLFAFDISSDHWIVSRTNNDMFTVYDEERNQTDISLEEFAVFGILQHLGVSVGGERVVGSFEDVLNDLDIALLLEKQENGDYLFIDIAQMLSDLGLDISVFGWDEITEFIDISDDGSKILGVGLRNGKLTPETFILDLSVAEVPLPAAVWLFLSAFLGIVGAGKLRSKRNSTHRPIN